MSQPRSKLERRLDADLHLLDRQIIDSEGALVGNVDDLELTEHDDGRLEVTGLLVGAAALVPRLGGRHSDRVLKAWRKINVQWRDSDRPGWISMDDIAHLDSAVRLSRPRPGLIVPQPEPEEGTRHWRAALLIESDVIGPDGPLDEHVRDLRLEPGKRPVVRALVVSRGRPGTLLGYDRSQVRSPVLVAHVLRWLNRHTGELSMADVARIDWEGRVVHASALPGPLTPIED